MLDFLRRPGDDETGGGPGRLPVPYDFLAGIPHELRHPGGSAAGSNRWDRKPTPEHPRPVILLHGTAGNRQTNWAAFSPLLANEGYSVFAPTFGALPGLPWPISGLGGMMPIERSAQEVGSFIEKVLAVTGAQRVDVLGHSQGTMVANYYIKYLGGAGNVHNCISLAPLWKGTNTLGIADLTKAFGSLGVGRLEQKIVRKLCAAAAQMTTGSEFLERMNRGGLYHPSVRYTNIVTRHDEVVLPYTNGVVAGTNATNIVLQQYCPKDHADHLAIAADPVAAGFVLAALDPENARPVPCQRVLPVIG